LADEQQNRDEKPRYEVGVLAGRECSNVPDAELSEEEKNEIKELVRKAEKRDYPARLVEVIQTWEAALFYRGFQFLIPQRGGGWIIPGESTGYGPSMQLDLALLPTNIYSARAQMIIAALTRAIPNVRFIPQSGDSDAGITAAEGADKFVLVIRRNNDLIMIQTDAARYFWTDGRMGYWSRFVKDGQQFGWEEDDQPDDIIPENAPPEISQTPTEAAATAESQETEETESPVEEQASEEPPGSEAEEEEEQEEPVTRTPRGQEIRTCHGKLEMKVVPMMANNQAEADVIILEMEVDVSRAKAMFPDVADQIKAGSNVPADGEIARLARQNVKLGMQSTYVTSDSVAQDATVKRVWMRPSWFMHIADDKSGIRDTLISKFPNGCFVSYTGEVFCRAVNESIDDAWALAHAYAGDGQNRNAMGTSTMPLQKRINNWLDLMNDFFVRAIPKKWMDNKTFNVEAVRGQTNVPGDIGTFKWRPGVPVAELVFVEPQVVPPGELADFIKEYIGPLAELLSGAYPALAGGDVGTADSGVAIATQRDSALGRLAPTWHSLKNAEAVSMKQLVRWGAKCRDKSINERIPGGQIIKVEINDLKGNILCYAESDENFPETYTQKKNNAQQLFTDAVKNQQLGELLFNAENLEFFQNMSGMRELKIKQVTSRNKQLGEIELLAAGEPIPNEQYVLATEQLHKIQGLGVDPLQLQQAMQQLAKMPQEKASISPDPEAEEVVGMEIEADTCWWWLNEPVGREAKKNNPRGYENVRLHYIETKQALNDKVSAQQGAGQGKPPSVSIGYKDVAMTDEGAAKQVLMKAGITPTAGAMQPPGGPPPAIGAKGPARPIPVGAPEEPPTNIQ
jgi:hypothetical protein